MVAQGVERQEAKESVVVADEDHDPSGVGMHSEDAVFVEARSKERLLKNSREICGSYFTLNQAFRRDHQRGGVVAMRPVERSRVLMARAIVAEVDAIFGGAACHVSNMDGGLTVELRAEVFVEREMEDGARGRDFSEQRHARAEFEIVRVAEDLFYRCCRQVDDDLR